jgi:hypothetical protein
MLLQLENWLEISMLEISMGLLDMKEEMKVRYGIIKVVTRRA